MTRDNQTKATRMQIERDDAEGAARSLERLERLLGAFAEELGRLEESLEALSDELIRLKSEREEDARSLH